MDRALQGETKPRFEKRTRDLPEETGGDDGGDDDTTVSATITPGAGSGGHLSSPHKVLRSGKMIMSPIATPLNGSASSVPAPHSAVLGGSEHVVNDGVGVTPKVVTDGVGVTPEVVTDDVAATPGIVTDDVAATPQVVTDGVGVTPEVQIVGSNSIAKVIKMSFFADYGHPSCFKKMPIFTNGPCFLL